MKKFKPLIIISSSIIGGYFLLAFVFRVFLYDAPPNVPRVQLAVFDTQSNIITDQNKKNISTELRNIKGISGITADPVDNRITVLYRIKETTLTELKTDIENKIGSELTEIQIPPATGKGCPYHGFLDKIAPAFMWF
jgi:hypothetical protein